MKMSAPEALALDMYGTLVDPIGIQEQLEDYLPGEALNWRGRGAGSSSNTPSASPRWSGTKISSR